MRILIALLCLCAATVSAQTFPSQWLSDVDGNAHVLIEPETHATAIVFLGTQCPISNRAIPTLNALAAKLPSGAAFYGIVSDPTVTRADVAKYRDDYKIAFPILFDDAGSLAKSLQPKVTPEAFVLNQYGRVVYRGRIDDSFASLGQANQTAKTHDLADALADVAADKPIDRETKAVGCIFEAWKAKDVSSAITYNRDIAPLLNANCVSCHRDGQVAPFSLQTYQDAAKRAEQLAQVTQSHYMPPWKPHANFNHFVGEHRLTNDRIALIADWAKAGAPQGDAKDLPPAPKFASGWTKGEPDLVVKMPEPFTVPAGGKDVYRAFVVPLNLPKDTYVAGVEFRPGAPTVVHHSLFFLDTTGAGRKLDAADPAPGYISFGGPGFTPTGGLGGWAPGADNQLLPEGAGRLVKAGSDLILQMHYHPDGREHQDQSSLAIYFQKKPVDRIIGSIPLTTRDIDIPAGEANYTRQVSLTLPTDLTLSGATPHMHLVGRDMKVTATQPDGTVTPIIWIDDWDFKWQGQYRFVKPITLPAGTRLDLVAHYDNSTANANNPNDPPARVKRGEQTTDEMCFCFLEYEASSPSELLRIRKAMVQQMISEGLRRRLLGS